MSTNTADKIAVDLALYLKSNSKAAASGSVNGWQHLRYTGGAWRLAQYTGRPRLPNHVSGKVVDGDDAKHWLKTEPAKILPASEAGASGDDDTSVWEDADEQDVFTDRDRCWWCGHSDRTRDLERYETQEDDECLLCSDCHESWERAGEIVGKAGGQE